MITFLLIFTHVRWIVLLCLVRNKTTTTTDCWGGGEDIPISEPIFDQCKHGGAISLANIYWWISPLAIYTAPEWYKFMMTPSNGNIFLVTGHLCGPFTGHRWIPRTTASDVLGFDVFFDLRMNKRLSKQSRGWWFETLLGSLWRHCNVIKKHMFRPFYRDC